jgi:hypothetical protein
VLKGNRLQSMLRAVARGTNRCAGRRYTAHW